MASFPFSAKANMSEPAVSMRNVRRLLALGRPQMLQLTQNGAGSYRAGEIVMVTPTEAATLEAGQMVCVETNGDIRAGRFARYDWSDLPRLVVQTDTQELLVDWDALLGTADLIGSTDGSVMIRHFPVQDSARTA